MGSDWMKIMRVIRLPSGILAYTRLPLPQSVAYSVGRSRDYRGTHQCSFKIADALFYEPCLQGAQTLTSQHMTLTRA